MLVANTLIAGSALSALYVGVNTVREEQQKKKMPWTSYAKKIEKKRGVKLFPSKNPKSQTILGQVIGSELTAVKGALIRFKENRIKPLFIDPRSEQLQEISANVDEEKLHQIEKQFDRDIMIALVSLGFASAGPLFYAPLSYLSIPGLSWLTFRIYEEAYDAFKEKKGVALNLIYVIYGTGAIVTGNYFAGALGESFFTLSRKLLSKTEDHSRQSLINVFGNQKRFVWLLKDGIEVQIPVENLKPDDIITVHAGETIAVDGTILSGRGNIDQRILTGESQPAEKEVGDPVFASTVVLSGQIQIRVEKAGEHTVAAQIGEILNQTADFKSSIQSWGETIADKSAQITLGLSGIVLFQLGSTAALTILNACVGVYMVVLGPLSMLSYLNVASKQSILVKDGRTLQLLTKVDTVVFDKTGTLTIEEPHVGRIYACDGFDEQEILTVAAAAEYKQTHPIAFAIRKKASQQGLKLPKIHDAEYEVGYGLKVRIAQPGKENHSAATSNQLIRVGSRRFMEMEGIAIPTDIKQKHQDGQKQGHSLIYVAINDQLAGALELHATIRPEAKTVVNELRKRNISMAIISGDHETPTRKLAQELGIEQYFAETLPENKADLIGKLQEEGKSVCFVGDGINDSIALKKANVSISLRGASSAATDAAQIVLMKQDLNQVLDIFDIAHNFERNMKINLATTMIPGLITFFGTFFLGFSLVHSVLLNNGGLILGASNALKPWLKQQKELDSHSNMPDNVVQQSAQ